MTTPKFKIGQKIFYKGHLHCTIMDIIQENFVFTYEVNMTLNNRNKVVDEWDLSEKKEKARFKNEPKVEKEKDRFVAWHPNQDNFEKQKTLDLVSKEINELKQMVVKLTMLVTNIANENKIDKSNTKIQEPIVKNVLQTTIDNLNVGQKKTFFNYTLNKVNECIQQSKYQDRDYHVVEIPKRLGKKAIQVYRLY